MTSKRAGHGACGFDSVLSAVLIGLPLMDRAGVALRGNGMASPSSAYLNFSLI